MATIGTILIFCFIAAAFIETAKAFVPGGSEQERRDKRAIRLGVIIGVAAGCLIGLGFWAIVQAANGAL